MPRAAATTPSTPAPTSVAAPVTASVATAPALAATANGDYFALGFNEFGVQAGPQHGDCRLSGG
jgi:hypothetical protein